MAAAALEVGFATPSAFIALFRRALGATPARYCRGGAGPWPPDPA